MYQQALVFAVKADNPRLKATTLNSLAVLQEMNGYLEKSREKITNFNFTVGMICVLFNQEESMASVNQICADYNIDLDDESEAPASQTTRSDSFDMGDEIDLEEFIGIWL